MFVTRSTGSFVAGAAAVNFVVFDRSGSEGTGDLTFEVGVHLVVLVGFSSLVAVHFLAECLRYFVEFVFDGHHLSLPLYFLQMGQFSPHPHFSAFGAVVALGVASSWAGGSIFMERFEVDVEGIGQSFLNSNKYPDIFPALGHGMPA